MHYCCFLKQGLSGLLFLVLISSSSFSMAESCFNMPENAPCEHLGAAHPDPQDLRNRLEAVSHAMNDFAALAVDGNTLLSVSNRGKAQADWAKSARWCEKVMQDVIDLRNIEIVKDVGDRGPIWVKDQGYVKKSASIDESFFVAYVYGRKVVSGYVNVLWNKEALLTLRVSGLCVGDGEVHRRCTGPVHSSVWIYGPDEAHSCDASAPDRRAWANWADKETMIHLTPHAYKTNSSSNPLWLKAGWAKEGSAPYFLDFDYTSIAFKEKNPKVMLRVSHTRPQRLNESGKEYRDELITASANCATGNFDALSRELKFSDGSYVGAGVSPTLFQEKAGPEKGAFLKSLCFLQQNGFDLPAISLQAQWDPMTSTIASTKLGEAKARRQYKNGVLLVTQRNDMEKAVEVDGTPSRTVVLISAFNCRKQTMNQILGFSYGLDEKPSGVFLFDEKDITPRLPENRQRFIKACAEMEAKD